MKSDSDEICNVINGLANESWLGSSRSKWVKYAFHYTDVSNAVKILESGKLICRRELEKQGAMIVDNASPGIISRTKPETKDYVRLYFRPRTPTQYRNEGIRPEKELWEGAHCPMPIFFLFDLKAILTRKDCKFSDRNLASDERLWSTADKLSSFDFKKIYHDSSYKNLDEVSRKKTTEHKNAEVVVHKELDLSDLKYIFCRSFAEKETFVNLLLRHGIRKRRRIILVDTKSNFFFRKWSYVQGTNLGKKLAVIKFSPDSNTPGPFNLTATLVSDQKKDTKSEESFSASEKKIYIVPEYTSWYEIEVKLDGNLAYLGRFDVSDEIPF